MQLPPQLENHSLSSTDGGKGYSDNGVWVLYEFGTGLLANSTEGPSAGQGGYAVEYGYSFV